MTAAYLLDRIGMAFTPTVMLPVGLTAFAVTLAWLGAGASWERADLATFVVIVSATFSWLMWVARPSFLPLGAGPDLTHHLLLIQYLEQHWRLVHGPGVEDYLGEMVYYTPGSHMLTALAGAWSRTTGLHALHAVMSAAAALKAGFVFLIAMRALPRDSSRTPLAAIAALALFQSQIFFLGSFAEFSFLAQVIAELFAVALWWTLVAWDEEPRWPLMLAAGVLGSAVFLTWPVLIGPPLVLLGFLLLLPRATPFNIRVAQAALAVVPIAIVAGLFIVGRTGMMIIAGTGGRAVWPQVSAYGAWFLGLSALGFIAGVFRARARTTTLFAIAIALQAAGLYWFARIHNNEPYMALKMLYLFLYVQAVAVAVGAGELWVAVSRGIRLRPPVAWTAAAVVAIVTVRPLLGAPQSLEVARHPATSISLEQAGQWARAHVPIKCVEYLVGSGDTAYWLHLAVLGNARQGARTADSATYELTPALVRWLTPGGLPYAIVDFASIPSGIRDELDLVARFDGAGVAKRRGPSTCDEGP